MRDVKDTGQQMGYRSLEWNWPKEATNRPIGAGLKIVAGIAFLLAFLFFSFVLVPVFDSGRYGMYS